MNKKTKVEKLPSLPEMSRFPSIRKGSKESGYITLIQTNLKNRGYYDGPVDGKFGDRTEDAVKSFQKDLGKPISGTVGPKTWEQLQKSMFIKTAPVQQEPVDEHKDPGVRVLIEGLTRYQAELLLKLLQGHTDCRIL